MKSIFISLTLALAVPLATSNLGSNRVAAADAQSLLTPSTLPSATTIAAAPSNWYNYTAKDNSYSAKFPGQPKEENKSLKSTGGEFNYLQVMYEDRSNNRAYLSMSKKIGVDLKQFNIEQLLDSVRDGQAEGGKATIISEEKISLNGYPGREITFRGEQGMVMKSRIFINLEKSTLYQMIVVAGDGNQAFPEAQTFLESLVILK